MTRQEQENLISPDPWLREKSEKEKLKEELREEVVKELKRKKRRRVLSCCFLEILFVLLILFLGTATVAKTGLFEIPFFSKIFYKQPEPLRVITPQQKRVENLNELFENKIKSQVKEKISPGEENQKVEIELEFTEEELTASLLRGIEVGSLPLSKAQIAISQKEIEIFGRFIKPEIFFTVRFQPKIQNGQITVKLTKIKLGNLSVPVFLSNILFERVLKDKLNQINEIIGKEGRLEEIRLENSKIFMKGIIDVIVFLK